MSTPLEEIEESVRRELKDLRARVADLPGELFVEHAAAAMGITGPAAKNMAPQLIGGHHPKWNIGRLEKQIWDLRNWLKQELEHRGKLERRLAKYNKSLRDKFAGQALQGLVANPGDGPMGGENILAKQAYAIADAMLAEREKEKTT